MILHYIRIWDETSANRVDKFIAISEYIAKRVQKTYHEQAQVIYPPVDITRFTPTEERKDYYMTTSRFVPYKRIDIIVEAFNQLALPLVVIGTGPEYKKIKAMAGNNIRLLGHQPDMVVTDYMQHCKAFIYAADEDFGITPVEAQAAGAPVIAYRKGGILETIQEETGLFYEGFFRPSSPSTSLSRDQRLRST